MTESSFVVAEPMSMWARRTLRFELLGGTAEERFIVFTSMRAAFPKHLVRHFPTTDFPPVVRSVLPRSVFDIIVPVLNFLPPTQGVTDAEAERRRAGLGRLEDGAR